MLNINQKALLEFVEDAAPAIPLKKRIRVYRGLADVLPVKRHRTRLLKKAMILEKAELACAELDFTSDDLKHDGHHNGGNKS